MELMFIIREGIISFYKRYEVFVLYLAKFLVGFIIFNFIGSLNYSAFKEIVIPGIPLNFLLGIIFAALPITPAYIIVIAYVALQTSAVIEVMLIVTLVLLCVLLLYVRLAPRESILIILTLIMYYLRIPYAAPMLAGLYFGLTSVIPVTIGVFIWYVVPIISSLLSTAKTAGLDIVELPATFTALYVEMLNALSTDSRWIFYAFIFAMVIIIVHGVSRMSIDYSKDVSIALGTTVMIVSFIIIALISGMDLGIFGIIFFTLVSAVLVMLLKFFDTILDYSGAESVMFEDEENVYYVKIVPKVLMPKRNRVVRRIRPTPEDFEDYEDYDEYEV